MRATSLRRFVRRFLLFTAVLANPAQGQAPLDRPASRPLDLPTYAPAEPGRVLPELVVPDAPSLSGLAAGRSFPVRQIAVRGATVLTPDEVRALVAPYEGRAITYAELEALRLTITRTYIERGYVTSGARIPDQDVAGGVVQIDVVEGALTDLAVTTDGRLRTGLVERRLARGARGPINVNALEEQLQILQQDPTIAAVNAVLLPGQRPGESRLEVSLEEAPVTRVELSYGNEENPAIGDEAGRIRARHIDVLGFGDEIAASYGKSDGYWEAEGSYELPLGSRGTAIGLRYSRSESEIVEPAYEAFDITSEAETWGLTLRQPLYRTLGASVEIFAGGEVRSSQTELLGEGFSFTPGPHDGETRLMVLRTGADATWRGARQVLAARIQGSFGLDSNDATRNADPAVPDARFSAVLTQLQWATRLPWLGAQFIARADAQFAADPLFGLEQFAIGGVATVRGYVESAIVRDSGLIVSTEARVPLYGGSALIPRVELAPFVDWGRAWNERGSSRGEDEELAGAGIGLRMAWRWISGEIYWADDMKNVGSAAVADALREEWHFALRARWPQ